MNTLPGREAKLKIALFGGFLRLRSKDGRSQDGGDFADTLASGHTVGMFERFGCHGQIIRCLK